MVKEEHPFAKMEAGDANPTNKQGSLLLYKYPNQFSLAAPFWPVAAPF